MASASPLTRRTPTGRRRGRPPGSTNAARLARQAALPDAVSEPPPKKRRYIPGGPGGGGRFVDPDSIDALESARPATVSRPRAPARALLDGTSPSLAPRRGRSTRIQGTGEELEEMRWGSAAAMAASVKQAEDYKPREERGWEEFHPNLDIDADFMVFRAEEVDGPPQKEHATPVPQTPATPRNGSATPVRTDQPASANNTPNAPTTGEANPSDNANLTPSRRSLRPTMQSSLSYRNRSTTDATTTPKIPKILPIQNQTAKEKLDLKLPSFRKTDRMEQYESRALGQTRYVDKAMSNVGYQESDNFLRSDRILIKAVELGMEEDWEQSPSSKQEDHGHHTKISRVEYDMDEQDDMWLQAYNIQRKQNELEVVTREVFEITLTKIEKEWHALEKRIPKPNPKPPQTHRPRSSSAAAVNGETQGGEEPDSRCAVCDDGDCENTNAIVFCDGCNLAVHQECYGVPFIPEGQWLCRKCQLCGRGVPTCIFCPNTDGAFKQTNSSKWAHLLCAMWIPEVSLGNHTFMEPVMEVEKVPKNRWKLSCYICNQRMGACIQCGNKSCYQAFHVTCARKARLYLKMKTPHGQLAVLDGSMVLKAFCDKHCPPDYTVENDIPNAIKAAKRFYRRNMKGRIWTDTHAMASAIAAQQRDAEANAVESGQGAEGVGASSTDKKRWQTPKSVWRLPSGAPVLPQAVFETVEASIQRFPFRKRKDFLGEACRYWTLKREARRGAALLKRLQLQMDSFSSMELTRRNFAAMGPRGKERLEHRIEFAENLLRELEQLKALTDDLVVREETKMSAAELEQDFVDEAYFPVLKSLIPAVTKAQSLDKNLFTDGLEKLQERIEQRGLVNSLSFAQELGQIITAGIIIEPRPITDDNIAANQPSKVNFADIRERRKLARRILKAIQPYLETAMRLESDITNKQFEILHKEVENVLEASVEAVPATKVEEAEKNDTIMVGSHDASEITVKSGDNEEDGVQKEHQEDAMDLSEDRVSDEKDQPLPATDTADAVDVEMPDKPEMNEMNNSDTPPGSHSFVPVPELKAANPPTPPQSNGSLGREPTDPLLEGGILWYLKGFEPEGTSVTDEAWAGRDAVRQLSQPLTDLDDEELKGLRADVDDAGFSIFDDGYNGQSDQAPVKEKLKPTRPRSTRVSERRR